MRMNFLIVLITVGFISQCSAQKPTGGSVYENCGQRNKKCFGDTDACVAARNCTFAISLTENRTHVDVIILNSCALPNTTSRDVFLGVGLTTNDNQGNPECREPTLDDYKVFILWNKIKCAKAAFFYSELNWMSNNRANWKSNCEYGKFINGTKPREDFNLGRYLQKNIILSTGDNTAPFNFADRVDYIVKDRMLYINRDNLNTVPAQTVFEYKPPNQMSNNNPHGQPRNSDPMSNENKSSSSMTLPYSLFSLFSCTIFILSMIQ